jgi:ATP-binding cassette subfamily C protein
MVLVTAAIEAAGAAAVFGLLRILTDPSAASHVVTVWPLSLFAWSGNTRTLVLSMTVAVIALYVFRLAVLGAVAALKERVAFDSVVELSDRILGAYLHGAFGAVARRPSSEMILRVDRGTEVTVVLGLSSFVQLAAELLVVAGLVMLLAVTAPLTTLFAVVGTTALLLLPAALTRGTFERYGEQEQELAEHVLQQLRQGLGALREIRVYGREEFFRAYARESRSTLASVQRRGLLLTDVLRLMVETVFVLVLLMLIVAVTWNSDSGNVVSLLGLYAYAGFRFVPSANRITLNLNNIRSSGAFVRDLCDDITALDQPEQKDVESADITFNDDIVFDDVTYRYSPDGPPALADIRLRIRRGESIGIVGSSGAGKSTLADLLLGLLEPTAGRVLVDGQSISRARRSWQQHIGYVAQSFYLLDESLRRNIAFGVDFGDIDEGGIAAAVKIAQLEGLVRSWPEGLDTGIGEGGARLSGGERQRVAIARALYAEPEVLVLDEATAALDSQTERDLLEAMEAMHGTKTMILIAHQRSTVSRCDRVVMLRDGRIHAVGSCDELMTGNAEFRALMTAGARSPA